MQLRQETVPVYLIVQSPTQFSRVSFTLDIKLDYSTGLYVSRSTKWLWM